MTLNSYSKMKGYKCNTVQKLKKKKNGFVSSLDIAHFSQSNMKHSIKTVKS